jgi:23S rRNA pseudouridine1911/1915/1917 synthase
VKKTTYTVEPEIKSERLDSFISSKSGLSRSYVQKLIKQGFLSVNSQREKTSYKIKAGDTIEYIIADEPQETLTPEDIPLIIIWEDDHIIVVNKPSGMVVHPAAGHRHGTLINALLSRCEKLASIGAPLRPGIVHRLDKDTSGLIVVAKDDISYVNLQKQFKKREVKKHYYALVYGNLKNDRGEINKAIGRAVSDRKKMSTRTTKGKEALTQFEVIKRLRSATLVKVTIITGRTHQIRVHFAASGHPVLGDKSYGKKTLLGNPLVFNAPIPEDIKKAIKELSA